MSAKQDIRELKTIAEGLLSEAVEHLHITNISSIGVDLADCKRFSGGKGESIARSILTSDEWDYCETLQDPKMGWASVWAAREAVYKATSGYFEIFPVLWKLEPIMNNRWKPVPKKPDERWFNFSRGRFIEVMVNIGANHAVAIAIVSEKSTINSSK